MESFGRLGENDEDLVEQLTVSPVRGDHVEGRDKIKEHFLQLIYVTSQQVTISRCMNMERRALRARRVARVRLGPNGGRNSGYRSPRPVPLGGGGGSAFHWGLKLRVLQAPPLQR